MVTVSAQRLLEHPVIGLPHIPVPSLEVGREAARVVLQLLEDPEKDSIQKVIACGRVRLCADTTSSGATSENGDNAATVSNSNS